MSEINFTADDKALLEEKVAEIQEIVEKAREWYKNNG